MSQGKIDSHWRLWLVIGFLSVVVSVTPHGVGAGVQYNYQLLEPIPGFTVTEGSATQFPQYVLALYQFGVWTVGIAAMFMLVFGGFMYVTSAGNTARVGTARKVITGALVGLVAALTTYLLLRVINPDLVRVDMGSITRPPGVTTPAP